MADAILSVLYTTVIYSRTYVSTCFATLIVLLKYEKYGLFLSSIFNLYLLDAFKIMYPSILFSLYYQRCLISWTPCGYYLFFKFDVITAFHVSHFFFSFLPFSIKLSSFLIRPGWVMGEPEVGPISVSSLGLQRCAQLFHGFCGSNSDPSK